MERKQHILGDVQRENKTYRSNVNNRIQSGIIQ
jgi:hypothetical protein